MRRRKIVRVSQKKFFLKNEQKKKLRDREGPGHQNSCFSITSYIANGEPFYVVRKESFLNEQLSLT